MNRVEEFLQVLLAAPDARKEAALQVLRGHALAIDPSAQPRPFEPLLTQRETARRLGVSVSTLWRWQVPGHDCGGWRRYRLSEVHAYLQTDEFKRRLAALRAGRPKLTESPDA